MVFLHGGGWVAGDLDTHDGVCRRLANASGCAVFAIDYRLAPEHPFPAGLDDACAAIAWVAQNAAGLGIDATKLVVARDSAGGGLAAAATLLARDGGGPEIALTLLICPILDLAVESASRQVLRPGVFPQPDHPGAGPRRTMRPPGRTSPIRACRPCTPRRWRACRRSISMWPSSIPSATRD